MNQTLETINQLRSIRNFNDQSINDKDLETILNASVRAANSSARQPYSIIVLKDKEKMKSVCGYQGAAALVYCVDYNRQIDIAKHLKEECHMDGIVDFITGEMDTILAAQTAAIAAKSLGIDSLLTNGIHRVDFQKTYELLELPDEYCFPLIVLVLGYTKEPNEETRGRICGAGIIHYDKYHHMNEQELNEVIDEYDEAKNKLGVYCDYKKEGFSHYYNWFFRVWSSYFEDSSDQFNAKLREIKFL